MWQDVRRWWVLTATQTRLLLLDRASLVSNLTLAIASMVVFGLLIGGDRATAAPVCRNSLAQTVATPRSRWTGSPGSDEDGSPGAAQVVAAFRASDLVNTAPCAPGRERAQLQEGRIAALVLLPAGFGADLASGQARAEVAS